MNSYVYKYKLQFILTIIFKVISSALWVYLAIVIKNLVDSAVSTDINKFTAVAIFSVFYFIAFVIFRFIGDLSMTYYKKNTITYLKSKIFSGVINRNFKDYKSKPTGEYISGLTNDINLFEKNYIDSMIELIAEVTTFIVTIYILSKINFILTIVLLIAGLMMFLIPYIFNKSVSKKQGLVSQDTSTFTGRIKDLFDGFEVIKSYSMENNVKSEFDNYNNKLEITKQKFSVFIFFTEAVSMVLSLICQFSGIILSGYFVLKGEMSVGILMAVMQLGNGIFNPIQSIVQYITMIKGCKELNEKLLGLANYEEKQSVSVNEFNKEIEIKNLSFSYTEDEKLALNNINLKIEKNKKYAILGESGCGKSTLTKILLNYYGNYRGDIFVDGKKLSKDNDLSLLKMSSMIHQNVYMFDKSIKDNIILGKEYDENILDKAVKNSGLYKFLNKDKSIDYQVGENGSNLSGGQKQRIAIARAIIQDRPILVLDEATSALDRETATEIENIILENKDLTVITVTHNQNPEILKKYDKIVIMDKGKITKIGKYEEVIA